MEKEESKSVVELAGNHQGCLEMSLEETGGAGQGQRRVEDMHCPLCRPAREERSAKLYHM